MKKEFVVYQIENLTNLKKYIGITGNFNKRISD